MVDYRTASLDCLVPWPIICHSVAHHRARHCANCGCNRTTIPAADLIAQNTTGNTTQNSPAIILSSRLDGYLLVPTFLAWSFHHTVFSCGGNKWHC